MGVITKLAAVALLALSLEGCGGAVMNYDENPMPHEYGRTVTQSQGNKPLQCVPYARAHSDVKLYGDAYTWWRQAIGKYETGFQPRAGAVLCFKPTDRMRLGHVAVVSQVLTDRIIQISHANWSPIGGHLSLV